MSEAKAEKKCSKCKLTYYTDAFWKSKQSQDGLKEWCVNCCREYGCEVMKCDVCGKEHTKAGKARHEYQCAIQQEAQLIGVSKFDLCHYYMLEGLDKQTIKVQRGVKYVCNCHNTHDWNRENNFAENLKQDIYEKIKQYQRRS
jgi:hypothetical protein